jgi:hypothetical protein
MDEQGIGKKPQNVGSVFSVLRGLLKDYPSVRPRAGDPPQA